MPSLIVVNNPKEWPFNIPGLQVVDARSYLTKPEYSDLRGVQVYNLCRSYRYQTLGYYVTLLAAARRHRPMPDITTIQDLKSQTVVRIVGDDLDELIQQALQPIHSPNFTLHIYFGHNQAPRYDSLCQRLFSLFRAPMLRATFGHEERKWELRNVEPIPLGDIPEPHRPFVLEVATDYFAGRRASVRKRAPMKYDLAILYDEEEEMLPSDPKAIQKFVKAAEKEGLRTEVITRDDFGRLAEFDALFIRETTRVNHHTYRFARRAAMEGLVVIDDPESILKCTNKVYMAELLTRHEIRAPKTLLVHKDNFKSIAPELGLPCVLKLPDAAFSLGVVKVETEQALHEQAELFLSKSDLVIAQEFLPTTFDWRIGVIDRQPLFACKYHMAPNHWQIVRRDQNGKRRYGRVETLPVEMAPRDVVRIALKTANLIGDGLYGVDVKQSGKQCYIIEVNDNPNLEAGVEDSMLKEELYRRIMSVILRRIERKKAGIEDE
jgi:glutathione synthase/RimK-type ligase-like ATP-grasp enzyme